MPNFIKFRDAVNEKIFEMENSKSGLFMMHIDKSVIWETYLGAFPEGSDPIYMENTVHDCNCCKDFIRDLGRAVSIDNENRIVTAWDICIDDEVYQGVADALADYVRKQSITSVYLASSFGLNTKENRSMDEAKIGLFSHFYYKLSTKYAPKGYAGVILDASRKSFHVLKRGLTELTVESLEDIKGLIETNSLYRGEQNLARVEEFLKLKKQFDLVPTKKRDNFVWRNTNKHESVVMFRNSVIGTLAVNLSEGMGLESAVGAYENMVAPDNYKRSSSVITKTMVLDAKKKVEELGLEKSLERRHASLGDITLNNVIWANKKTTAKLNNSVFDDLISETVTSFKPKDGKDIGLLDFIEKVVPNSKSIQAFLETRHAGNMVSLVAPVHKEAPNLMKWDNNFSWSYNGDMTDSIKARVEKKGGNVEGDLRISLSWFNSDDLDLALNLPNYRKVYFGEKKSGGFELDVDMNVHTGASNSTSAVENIAAKSRNDICEGRYTVEVTNFTKRNTDNVGFEVEVEYLGKITTFSSSKSPNDRGKVEVASFKYTYENGVVFEESSLDTGSRETEVWGLKSGKFHNVNSIMFSPNHWDDNKSGNRHLFFMIDECNNPEPVRGFYNEYLVDSLHNNRKVFEVLAGSMKAEPTPDQLSGLGFSTTKRGDVVKLLVESEKGTQLYNVTT